MNTTADARSAASAEEHVVIFRLDDEYYAFEIQAVQEIVRMQSITAIPGSDPWVEGITNLRGRVVPVIDLRQRCGMASATHTPETRIVVVNGPDGMVGFTVDAVTEVMRIPVDQVEPPSSLSGIQASTHLRGIAKLHDRLVSLMDLSRILPSLELAEAAETEQAAA